MHPNWFSKIIIPRSKGFRFYCHSQGLKIIETRHVFLENEDFSGRTKLKKLTFNEVSTLMMEYGVTQEDSYDDSENVLTAKVSHYKENVKRWRFLSVKIDIRWCFSKASYLRLSSYEFPIVDAFHKCHLLWRLTMTLIESVIILNLGAL